MTRCSCPLSPACDKIGLVASGFSVRSGPSIASVAISGLGPTRRAGTPTRAHAHEPGQRHFTHIAPEAQERRIGNVKRFSETLRVTNPVRQSRANPAGSESCVVAGDRPLRSVDSEVKRCVIEPINLRGEPSSLSDCGGREPGISGTWTLAVPGHTESEERGDDPDGFWELGRPCRLHRGLPAGLRPCNSRLIHSSVPSWWGRTGDERWYRQAKETKRGEMDDKESQRPIVVLKRGNGPSGPRGAKGAPRRGRGIGTTPRTPRLEGVSPREPLVV